MFRSVLLMMKSLLVLEGRELLLHSALHSDEAFLVEELFHDLVVLGTLRDTRDGLVALQLVSVLILFTAVLVVRVLHVLEHFVAALLVHVTARLLRLQFATLGMLLIVGVGEDSLGVTLGEGVGANARLGLATLDVGGRLAVSQGEHFLTLLGVTLLVVGVLGTADHPVVALLLGREGEHVLLTVGDLAPLSHEMVDTTLGVGVTLGVVLLLGLAGSRVGFTLLLVGSTTHLVVRMLGVPVDVLVTALRLVLLTTHLVVQSTDVLPATLAALSGVLRQVTAHLVVLVGGVLEDFLGAALARVLLAALGVVGIVHIREHLGVTLGTAG